MPLYMDIHDVHQRESAEHPIQLRIGTAALVSAELAALCSGKSLGFRDLGEVSLKGFDRPVRVHAVDWPGDEK